MRRGVWVTMGGFVGGMAAIPVLIAQGHSLRGLYPLALILMGTVIGTLVGGVVALRSRRREEPAFRAELDHLRFRVVSDSATAETGSFLERLGLFCAIAAVRDAVGSPYVAVLIDNARARSLMELAVAATTMAPDSWPEFEVADHPPAAERRLPAMRKELDGVFGPEFDERFKVRCDELDRLRRVLTEATQRQLLTLPRGTRVMCRLGELGLERAPADPGDLRAMVAVCDALGDLRRPPPPTIDELAALRALG